MTPQVLSKSVANVQLDESLKEIYDGHSHNPSMRKKGMHTLKKGDP